MIRPLTIATFLLACGSGLYLYQSKHEVQLLDRTIERSVHETAALREQSRLLAAEWTMLNDPERLRQFSDTYLTLKTITPSQFTSLAELDNRLPAPRVESPPTATEEPDAVPVAAGSAPQAAPEPAPAPAALADEVLPVPPVPTAPPASAVASVVRPTETRAPDRPPAARQVITENQAHSVAGTKSSDQHPEQRVATRLADARADVRAPVAPPPRPIVLAAPRPLPSNMQSAPVPVPANPAVASAQAPYSGSLLGMARGSMPPAPRPTPVSASYNAN